MAEWQVARLIPTWGINSDAEAEMRASSAMLAVLSIVRDFSAALLNPLGAPSARKALVETFVEVAFKLDGGIPVRPDGLIRVTYGKKVFTALVEVKTGRNGLQADQVNGYWEVARQFGFDAVLTISNEIPVSGRHPTEGLKFRSKSRVQVHHLSWAQVLATAVMCSSPRRRRRGAGLDPRRADPLSGERRLRSPFLFRHGPELGEGTGWRPDLDPPQERA